MTTLNIIQISVSALCYLAIVLIIGLTDGPREKALKVAGTACAIMLGLIAILPILIFFGIIDAIAKLF